MTRTPARSRAGVRSRRSSWGAAVIAATVGSLGLAGAGQPVVALGDAELIDATVRGIVFVDFDRDGRVDPGESDLAVLGGQQIEVSSVGRRERARSADDGSFSLQLPNLVAEDGVDAGLRVELPTPPGFTPSFGTAAVQHVRVSDGGETEVRFGLVPESRCPDDPATIGDPSGRFPDGHPNSTAGKFWTTCFVDGSATSPDGAQDVLVASNVDTSDWEPAEGTEFGGHLDVEHLATKQQMGAVWGVAYDEWDGVLYASAVIKRHSDLGPEGVDGLYWRSSDGQRPEIRSVGLDSLSPEGVPSFGVDPVDCPRTADGASYAYDAWSFDATAVGGSWDCRDLAGGGGGSESFDWWAFDRVGRDGIGDIDVTPDGRTLLVLNATADAVFVYDITAVNDDVAEGVTPRFLRHHEVLVPECVRGSIEAWGLTAIDAASAYVGATCTAEESGSVDDLASHVVRLEIDSGASTTVVSVEHDHPHGPGYVVDAGPNGGRFQPWWGRDAQGRPVMPPLDQAVSIQFRDFLDAWGYGNSFDWHQPLLSDIEIDADDGSLVLAIMDRWPMMTGVFNCDLDPSDGDCGYEFPAPPAGDYDGVPGDDPVAGYTGGVIGYVAGDLVRACNRSSDPDQPDFVVEGGAGCDPSEHSPRFDEPFGGGPAGEHEWYWNDQAFTDGGTSNPHPEAAQGAVASLDQRDDIVYTAMNATETFGAGLSRDANDDGAHVDGIQFFRTDFREPDGTGWKSAGLGDVEACSVPLEIGDHVWFDANVDGVRDPDEPPIEGVVISLVEAESGLTIATTATDRGGNWALATADGVEPLTEYVVRYTVGRNVSVPGVTPFELVPTIARADDARADLDSDLPRPAEPGLPLEVTVRTGAPGVSDHTIDAGFAPIGEIGAAELAAAADGRPGPPWRILGILFASIVVVGALFVLVLRRWVW